MFYRSCVDESEADKAPGAGTLAWRGLGAALCLIGCAAWCAALQRLEPAVTWRARSVGLKRREEP